MTHHGVFIYESDWSGVTTRDRGGRQLAYQGRSKSTRTISTLLLHQKQCLKLISIYVGCRIL